MPPTELDEIQKATEKIGFSMPSDAQAGSLLRTLSASKPGGLFLELGTGTGLSLAWILDGMDKEAKVISIDHDPELVSIAQKIFEKNERITILCADGDEWIPNARDQRFDLIFADAWPGKFRLLEETLALLKPGGYFVIDDMLPEPNWPEGHAEKAQQLIADLENNPELVLTKMNWSTGLIVAVKKSDGQS